MHPVRSWGVGSVHFGGDLLAQLAAGFASNDIDGFTAGDLIEPRGEDGIGRELPRLAGEFDESRLSDFFGQLP